MYLISNQNQIKKTSQNQLQVKSLKLKENFFIFIILFALIQMLRFNRFLQMIFHFNVQVVLALFFLIANSFKDKYIMPIKIHFALKRLILKLHTLVQLKCSLHFLYKYVVFLVKNIQLFLLQVVNLPIIWCDRWDNRSM